MSHSVYIYLLLFGLLVALVLSFATRQRHLRLAARIVALGIILSSVISIGLDALLSRVFEKGPPPTLAELEQNFPKRQQDMEILVRMSDEDPAFALITPTFSDSFPEPPGPKDIRNQIVDESLPEARWNQYRALFNHDDIKLGLWRNPAGDIFIMVDSFGEIRNGNAIGYLYCRTAERSNTTGFEPCESNQTLGSRKYDRDAPVEAYAFEKLADHWYVYDQGPSELEAKAQSR